MTVDPQAKTLEQPDDSDIGLAMLLIFTAAILLVTGAVAVLALVGSWWMLGAAVGAHVAMTAVVTATIVYSMSGRTMLGEWLPHGPRSAAMLSPKAASAARSAR